MSPVRKAWMHKRKLYYIFHFSIYTYSNVTFTIAFVHSNILLTEMFINIFSSIICHLLSDYGIGHVQLVKFLNLRLLRLDQISLSPMTRSNIN